MSAACCAPEDADQPVAGAKPAGIDRPDSALADDAQTIHDVHHDAPAPWWRERALALPVLAGFLLAVGYGLEWTGFPVPAVVVLGASLLAGAWTFVPGALRRLVRGRLGVGLLMTIAAAGAVLLGHVGEAAALAFLFSIAEALEDRAMDRAKLGLRALLSVMPETARLSRLSGDVVIPAADVREFDLLVVGAGERVATDGVVVDGRSSIDTSAVTGESIPVDVGPGVVVPAGSINGGGVLLVEATADGRDNSVTTIVRLVEEAQARSGRRARLADRIARPLVPAVLIVAAAIVVFGFIVGDPLLWTERALVVLVAASPCALAIAVPVTVISAIGAASRFGVVITSGAAFEQLGAVRTIAIDKTGTLTRNRPEVIEVVVVEAPGGGVATLGLRQQVLALAAAVEAGSTHPLASALAGAVSPGFRSSASAIVEHPGQGVQGIVDGVPIRVGSTRWIDAGPLSEQISALEAQGASVVVVEAAGETIGAIGIRDEVRPEAAEAIALLQRDGVEVIMLTGDNRRTAHAIADRLGITDVRAELLPADKADAVEQAMSSAPTAMIGDGINDAPALATASVGIAIGVGGSAVAVEAADVAFTGTDLRLVPRALGHARRGRRIMTGNIVLALAIIVVLFPLALFGVLGLAGVVVVHEIAEVVVIANGLRAGGGRRRTIGRR